jgi:homoserine O-acetyltransferase
MNTITLPQFELIGRTDAPVVVVLGGISASRHVAANDDNPTPGWWESVVGSCKAIDPAHVRVLGVDFLDGGCGSDGRPERVVTTHDQADAIAQILNEIGVARVHAIVGASYGGMVGLAFAEAHPDRLERLVIVSAPHQPHPMATALRSLQRRIVHLGIDTGEAPESLALARGLAMTTYRSAREFAERFECAPVERSSNNAIFPVEGYLRHHGERFAATWTPERFLALSLSSDLHNVDASRIHTPTTVVAAEGDTIVPRAQLDALVRQLAGPVRFAELLSINGHDAFLTEPDQLAPILESALSPLSLS